MFFFSNFSTWIKLCILPEVGVSRVPNISKKYEARSEHSVQWICKSFLALYLKIHKAGEKRREISWINLHYDEALDPKLYLLISIPQLLARCFLSSTPSTDKFLKVNETSLAEASLTDLPQNTNLCHLGPHHQFVMSYLREVWICNRSNEINFIIN